MNTVKSMLPAAPDPLHTTFLSMVPRIERHARVYFRNVKDPNRKADCVQETVALCWKWLLRLNERGKDATQFVSTLATFAAKAVRCGRRLRGQESAKDVLSEAAQRNHSFSVGKLPDLSTLNTNLLMEALADNTQTPPPEAAAFRIDFPCWRRTHARRNRRLIDSMLLGERTQQLARHFQLSPARISQLRRLFHDDWSVFCADRCEALTAAMQSRTA
jgi:DNA-directed RNA polymerase specialized sigma24 family protein